jgi:hypothetical protein
MNRQWLAPLVVWRSLRICQLRDEGVTIVPVEQMATVAWSY